MLMSESNICKSTAQQRQRRFWFFNPWMIFVPGRCFGGKNCKNGGASAKTEFRIVRSLSVNIATEERMWNLMYLIDLKQNLFYNGLNIPCAVLKQMKEHNATSINMFLDILIVSVIPINGFSFIFRVFSSRKQFCHYNVVDSAGVVIICRHCQWATIKDEGHWHLIYKALTCLRMER